MTQPSHKYVTNQNPPSPNATNTINSGEAAAAQPALEVERLTVSFGGVTALRDVSLSVAAGERRAIVGPNGAGKSTLFNAIGGQLIPNAGRVSLLGHDVTRAAPSRRTAAGLSRTWQITNLFQSLSVQENVALAVVARSPARRVWWRSMDGYQGIRQRGEELLREWDLWQYRAQRVSELSYGLQRILEIVVALASRPKVLLLDEPTAGLAPSEAARMTRLTCSLPDDMTIVIIEHDMAVAFAVAQTMTVLVDGAVLASGPLDEVRGNTTVIEAYLGEHSVSSG
ncbi:ABC transporter ATP-binding protein [Actinophytocola sp.]|uniref:ABC transporter ATP-binding protein n=1 Tax=Actinophytocola sp. TaxID=1872138 RepID=UPI003D6C3924